MFSFDPILASGDNWGGLVMVIIIMIVSGLNKLLEKKKGESSDRPVPPPPRPGPVPQRPARPSVPAASRSGRQVLNEQQVQDVLRRMRQVGDDRKPGRIPSYAPPPLPPVVTTKPEEQTRRLVELNPEKPELPSAHPEQTPHAVVLPSVHPDEVPHVKILPSVHPEEAPHFKVLPSARGLQPTMEASVVSKERGPNAYRKLLRSRSDLRHAIVLRELLGPPLALREEPFERGRVR